MPMPNPNSNGGPWCVICEVEKKSTNHWFGVSRQVPGLTFFQMLEWNDCKGSIAEGYDPVCGEGCAHKALDKWFKERASKAY